MAADLDGSTNRDAILPHDGGTLHWANEAMLTDPDATGLRQPMHTSEPPRQYGGSRGAIRDDS